MAGDIRYAAVDDGIHQKLTQALSIIRMRTLKASIDEWDGQPCDLLVAEAKDDYGKAAIEEAFGRGIPVVIVGEGQSGSQGVFHLPRDSSIAGVTRILNGALQGEAHRA